MTFTTDYLIKAKYSTRSSRVWVENNIIIVETFPGTVMDISDANEDLSVMAKLMRFIDLSRPYALIVDISGIESVSKDAVDAFIDAGKSEKASAIAVAFVVKSTLARIIGNFLMNFKSIKKDKKLFNDMEKAKKWITERILSKN